MTTERLCKFINDGYAVGMAYQTVYSLGENTDDIQNIRVEGCDISFEIWQPWPWSNERYVLQFENNKWYLQKMHKYLFGGSNTLFGCSGDPSDIDDQPPLLNSDVYFDLTPQNCVTESFFYPSIFDDNALIDLPDWVAELIDNPSFEQFDAVINDIALDNIFVADLLVPLPQSLNNSEFKIPKSLQQIKEIITSIYYVGVAMGQIKDAGMSAEEASYYLSTYLAGDPLYLDALLQNPLSKLAYNVRTYIEKKTAEFVYADTKDHIKVAAIQFMSAFTYSEKLLESNLDQLKTLAEEAAKNGAKFIVTPEAAVQGYADIDLINAKSGSTDIKKMLFNHGLYALWCHESAFSPCPGSVQEFGDEIKLVDVSPFALDWDSPQLSEFGQISDAYRVYISVGYIEKAEENGETKIYNSINVYGPEGAVIYHYRKTNLYPSVDKYVFTESVLQDDPFFKTEYGMASAAICYDVHNIFEKLYSQKIDILLYSVAWISSPIFYQPNYWEVGRKVGEYPINVVMANWNFKNGNETSIKYYCDMGVEITEEVDMLYNKSEVNGGGLSYVMDAFGGIRGILVDAQKSAILYAELPLSP